MISSHAGTQNVFVYEALTRSARRQCNGERHILRDDPHSAPLAGVSASGTFFCGEVSIGRIRMAQPTFEG
jgi:hypothetical protein